MKANTIPAQAESSLDFIMVHYLSVWLIQVATMLFNVQHLNNEVATRNIIQFNELYYM